MGLKDLMDKYGVSDINKDNWFTLRQFDKELGQEYDAEAYKVDEDVTIAYDYKRGTWQDNKGREYDPVREDGAITGFRICK